VAAEHRAEKIKAAPTEEVTRRALKKAARRQ